jgi:hypothetical protein
MNDPYFSDDTLRRQVIDIDAALDGMDFDDDEVLGADDLTFALGRPSDLDLTEAE